MLINLNQSKNRGLNRNNLASKKSSPNKNLKIETLTSPNNKSKISFTSYKGYKWYGTQETRKALEDLGNSYMFNSDIDQNIGKYGKDKGIIKSYTTLTQEVYPNIYKGINAFKEIMKEYVDVSNKRYKELAAENIDGSDIPFLGFTIQTMGMPNFLEDMRSKALDVNDDLCELVGKYWNGKSNAEAGDSHYFDPWLRNFGLGNNGPFEGHGIGAILNQYLESSDYLWRKIEPGPQDNNKMIENINKSRSVLCDHGNNYGIMIDKIFEMTNTSKVKLLDYQEEKQISRFKKKIFGRVFLSGFEWADIFK